MQYSKTCETLRLFRVAHSKLKEVVLLLTVKAQVAYFNINQQAEVQ
jgi:hypothetical protein